ncbi:hypothetical protein [Bradyrhizobium sp. 1(2017)]|uniref:hypothetical protein n=1 Tax=Bradyrhizobium sp. 1(2017) TaxID=1404888 RepID=UPI00140F4167|nr:hypothetical protein [Bradyrhizobium sp. 1(2017)]QIO30941.1 hypothetical protein HAP40_03460 [Bradyrhizobium sp. 1(2017)]
MVAEYIEDQRKILQKLASPALSLIAGPEGGIDHISGLPKVTFPIGPTGLIQIKKSVAIVQHV